MRKRNKATIAATNRGGIGLELGSGGGGGTTEGILNLKNHSASTYIGWVSGTMPPERADYFGTWLTDGTRTIGFGRNVGEANRMVHVLIPAPGIAPAGTLTIDLSTCTPTGAPAMGSLADVPSVGGVALTLQTTTDDGPIRIYRYQGKLNTWFTATVWIYYAHGHNHHEVEMLITCSNNDNPDLDHKSIPSLVLTIGAGVMFWTGTVPAAGGNVAATATLTASSVNDGDTVYCNNIGSPNNSPPRYLYTFRDTLSGGINEVKRDGASLTNTLANLRMALNASGTPGVNYSADITQNLWVNATASDATTVSCTARAANESGNWINALESTGGVRMSWGAGFTGGAGFSFGSDTAQGFCGCLLYGAVAADIASKNARIDHPVELWSVDHIANWPPLDRGPMVTATFNADTFRTANLPTLKANVGTWNYSGLGPWPNSGVSGLQESEGWSSCCEAFDLNQPNAGTIFVRKLGAMELSRRQINYREANGNQYSIATRPNSVQFHGFVWGPDIGVSNTYNMCGKTRSKDGVDAQKTGTGVTWIGADGQHYMTMILPESYLLTGSLLLQELIISWSVNWRLTFHNIPGYPITRGIDQFEPRSHGWCSFGAFWLYVSLDDRSQADALAADWRAKIDATFWPTHVAELAFGKPAVGIFSPNGTALTANRWMFNGSHLLPGNYDPAGLAIDRYPGSYIENVSPDQAVILVWHHTIGAGGVFCAWKKMGGDNALLLARQMAAFVVDQGWFLDTGVWRAANTVGVNLANDLTGNRFSDNSFHEWSMLGVSVFLELESSSHPLWIKANAIHAQRLAALNATAIVHKWVLPIP